MSSNYQFLPSVVPIALSVFIAALFEHLSQTFLRYMCYTAKSGHSVRFRDLLELGQHDQVPVGAHVQGFQLFLWYNTLDVCEEVLSILRIITPFVHKLLSVIDCDVDRHMNLPFKTLVVEVFNAFQVRLYLTVGTGFQFLLINDLFWMYGWRHHSLTNVINWRKDFYNYLQFNTFAKEWAWC